MLFQRRIVQSSKTSGFQGGRGIGQSVPGSSTGRGTRSYVRVGRWVDRTVVEAFGGGGHGCATTMRA